VVSEISTKKMKPFSDGKKVKACLEAVAVIYKISLSRLTAGKKIEKELSNKNEESLKMKAANFQLFSIETDENIYVSNIEQLDMEFNITEESAVLMPVKGATTAADLYEEVKKGLQNLDFQ
jgi:hypothetical protein